MRLSEREVQRLRSALGCLMETTPAGPDLEDIGHRERDIERLRLSRAWIGGVAFLAVAAAILPFRLAPSRTGEATNITATNNAAPNPPVLDLGSPVWEGPGEVMLGPMVDTADGFLVTGIENSREDPWPAFTLTSTDGHAWTEVWRQVGAPELSPVSDGTITLARLVSTDVAPSVFQWSGESWIEIPLPLPAGSARAAVQTLTATDGGWVAAGLSSPSSFDQQIDVALWRSVDGSEWTTEIVSADVGTIFYLHEVLTHNGVETVVASARLDELAETDAVGPDNKPHPLLIRHVGGSWQIDDLSPLTAQLTGPGMQNLGAIGSQVVDGALLTWWHADNGIADQPEHATLVTRVSASGELSAEELGGPLLSSIVVDDETLYALGGRDPLAGTPASHLMTSTDGVTWVAVAVLEGGEPARLLPLDDADLLVTGSVQSSVGAAIWILSAPSRD